MSKSALFAVGAPHTWPGLLAALAWLVEMLSYEEKAAAARASSFDDRAHLDPDLCSGIASTLHCPAHRRSTDHTSHMESLLFPELLLSPRCSLAAVGTCRQAVTAGRTGQQRVSFDLTSSAVPPQCSGGPP